MDDDDTGGVGTDLEASDADAIDVPVRECPEHHVCLSNWPIGAPPRPLEDDEFYVELQFPANELPGASDQVVTSLDAQAVPELERLLNPEIPGEGSYQPLDTASTYLFDFDIDGDGANDLLVRRLSGERRVDPARPERGERYVTEVGWVASNLPGTPGPFERYQHCRPVLSLDADPGQELVCRDGTNWYVRWSSGADRRSFASIEDIPAVRTFTVVDFDGDGDGDLFAAIDRRRNRVFRNDGGRLVDVTESCGISGAEKRTFYLAPVSSDPTDAASPPAVLVDNDLELSNAESYLALGGRLQHYERVPVGSDVLTQIDYSKLVGESVAADTFSLLTSVDAASTSRPLSTTPDGHIIRGHAASPDDGRDDLFDPMGVIAISLGPYWFEMKTQIGEPIANSAAVFVDENSDWRIFQPYELDGPRSTGGYWQHGWGAVRVPTGAPHPVVLMTRGNFASDGGRQLDGELIDNNYRAFGFAMDGFADSFGHSVQTAYTFDENAGVVPVDIGVETVGDYQTAQVIWRQYDWDTEPTVYVVLGGMGGYLSVLRVPSQGNVARLELQGTGPRTNPNGCGSNVYIQFGGRTVARIPCWEMTQIHLGNVLSVIDQGVGATETVDVVVDWRTNGDRRIERWDDVPADRELQVLVEGTGTELEALPRFW